MPVVSPASARLDARLLRRAGLGRRWSFGPTTGCGARLGGRELGADIATASAAVRARTVMLMRGLFVTTITQRHGSAPYVADHATAPWRGKREIFMVEMVDKRTISSKFDARS